MKCDSGDGNFFFQARIEEAKGAGNLTSFVTLVVLHSVDPECNYNISGTTVLNWAIPVALTKQYHNRG